MTRPDVWESRMQSIPDTDFAKAAEVVKANFNLNEIVDPEAYATIIAEAMITARSEQREGDARIAETADRPWRNTGSLIAAAIRNGGK